MPEAIMPDVKPFFPRGDGPLITCILCTRGRPQPLCKALGSMYDLAKDKSLIDFYCKVDDDDTDTIATLERLKGFLPLQTLQTPRGRGYHSMGDWLSEMASKATGDWIMVINDDMEMKTQDWDQYILNVVTRYPWPGITGLCLLVCRSMHRPFAQEFFLIRRRSVELLGNMGVSTHIDNYLHSVFHFMEFKLDVSIEINHYSDIINDQTRLDSTEAHPTSILPLISFKGKKQKIRDAEKLLAYSGWASTQFNWRPDPKEPGWYFWRAGLDIPGRLGTILLHPTGVVVELNENATTQKVWNNTSEKGGIYTEVF